MTSTSIVPVPELGTKTALASSLNKSLPQTKATDSALSPYDSASTSRVQMSLSHVDGSKIVTTVDFAPVYTHMIFVIKKHTDLFSASVQDKFSTIDQRIESNHEANLARFEKAEQDTAAQFKKAEEETAARFQSDKEENSARYEYVLSELFNIKIKMAQGNSQEAQVDNLRPGTSGTAAAVDCTLAVPSSANAAPAQAASIVLVNDAAAEFQGPASDVGILVPAAALFNDSGAVASDGVAHAGTIDPVAVVQNVSSMDVDAPADPVVISTDDDVAQSNADGILYGGVVFTRKPLNYNFPTNKINFAVVKEKDTPRFLLRFTMDRLKIKCASCKSSSTPANFFRKHGLSPRVKCFARIKEGMRVTKLDIQKWKKQLTLEGHRLKYVPEQPEVRVFRKTTQEKRSR